MARKQQGFTLIEIAIVLVIIGLLLGGVLKGQELIQSARVRNLISQQDGIKAAYFGFLDRYRSLPGDYLQATANIPGCVEATCPNGNGNGQIEASNNEHIAVWSHLSKAGFITGSYDFNATESTSTTPSNPYGSLVRLIYDGLYHDGTSATGTPRHNFKTGNNIPSDILAEVDRKIDDGRANAGQFRHTTFSNGAEYGDCADAANNHNWRAQNPVANCAGASLF
jgi:prepilin-type N-terminal cleavage/methylation domain-containing protein